MSRPATGRRPDSLFDNRYRYDYIYPRGRSGETLRAYDTLNGDQPVVIKRPALQDAPPMRAGQEVSILNEKRALERLSGHPVLTELLHAGTFRVGGQTHQYITMDMAQGVTVESLVLELAARGERLPELEMLVIFDELLDLLQAAHDHKIIYNDVDAKHLFWDRASYHLKVIDWGNAVFLDAENVPAHASRATDILQTGQLLYFVLSGGRRPEVGRADTAGDLGDEVSPRLKAMINKAVNPDLTQRYADIAALRNDLAELRRPLEKNRDALIERVRSRLPGASSQDQLEQLRDTLHEALQISPGYPQAVALLGDVETRLKQLAIQGDLDAVRIYMSSGNMGRASSVLDEIAARAGDTDQPLLSYLLDACMLLQANLLLPLPAGFAPALDALFQNDVQAAGRLLVTTSEARPPSHLQQLLLAERLTVHMPGVVLLRPHLVRLEDQLSRLPGAGPQLAAVRDITTQLDAETAPGVQALLRVYHRVSDALMALVQDLKGIGGDSIDSPGAVASRAQHAADNIVDLLDVVMQNVLSDPSRAGNALWRAGTIDPANPAFDTLSNMLNAFHAGMDKLQGFTPAADGADIAAFLVEAQAQLKPYAADISDPRFQAVVKGVETAIAEWAHVTDYVAMGGRRPAMTACRQAADAIRPLNVASARWFDEMQRRIEEAPRVEHLSPNVTLGRALAEGWEAWDRGRGGESHGLGDKALAAATSDSEKQAARRLIDLSEVVGAWLANDGPGNPQRTDQAEEQVMALLLPDEDAIQRKFSEQMPNTQIYLKAMSRGVVEPMRDMSAAAVRALFLHYVLRGMLALQQEKPEEANFWKEAASKTLNNARLHPAFQALDTAITRRQLVLEAVRALNNVKHVEDLAEARTACRAPLASAQLEAADQAMRAIDDALRRWPDGEFRTARQLLDTAVERIAIAEAAMGKDLTPFKTWLQDLAASAEVLQQARRTIEQAALVPADDPDPAVSEAHQKLVDVTRRDLGESYAAQVRQWRDTYNAVRDVYVDSSLTKPDKLHLLDRHFASLFIDRQPALPIFRHWQSLVQRLPDPKPVYTPPKFDAGSVDIAEEYAPAGYVEIDDGDDGGSSSGGASGISPADGGPSPAYEGETSAASPGRTTSPLIVAAVIIVLVIAAVVVAVLVLQGRQPPGIPVTPGSSANGTNVPGVAIDATNTLEPPTATAVPTNTELPAPTQPTSTPLLPPTITRLVPTPTNPTATPTPAPPTVVPTAGPSSTLPPTLGAGSTPGAPIQGTSVGPLPTLPPDATGGDYDVLKALETFPSAKIPWNKDWFGPGGNGWQFGSATLKTNGGPVVVRIGPDVLSPLFGADAARHLTRVDADVELVSYERSLLPTGQVAFGVGLESLQGQRATVQAMLVQANVLSLGMNLNGRFVSKTQLPVTTVKLGMSVQRNADGTLSLYVDNQLVGQSNAAFAVNSPVTIYLFASASGVVANITSMTVHLE